MGLLDLRKLGHLAHIGREPTPTAGAGLGGSGYALVYNPPDALAAGYQRGWTLAAWPAGPRSWSTPLAARGAGVHAGPRVAQAVAVRVLAEYGVAVADWAAHRVDTEPGDTEPGRLSMFRARLSTPTTTPPPAAGRALRVETRHTWDAPE